MKQAGVPCFPTAGQVVMVSSEWRISQWWFEGATPWRRQSREPVRAVTAGSSGRRSHHGHFLRSQ